MIQYLEDDSFQKITLWRSFLFDSGLCTNTKLIGVALADMYTPGEITYVTKSKLSHYSSITSSATIRHSIAVLKSYGWIATEKKSLPGHRFHKTVYFFKGVNADWPTYRLAQEKCATLEMENKNLLARCELLENKLSEHDKDRVKDKKTKVCVT